MSIPIIVLEAAVRGGLPIQQAVVTPEGDTRVLIPGLRTHPTDDWTLVDHDPFPHGPHPDDGLCHACEDLDERVAALCPLVTPLDPDYTDSAYDAYGHPVWTAHPAECRCEICDPEAAAAAYNPDAEDWEHTCRQDRQL